MNEGMNNVGTQIMVTTLRVQPRACNGEVKE